MLSDEVFLQAIRADLQDDAPWLIYADWLEERGDLRAALYRRPRLTNALGMQFVLVPQGTFWMGDRGSQKQVAIPRAFYMAVHPVTQEQWQAIMGSNPSYFSRSGNVADKVRDITDTDLKLFPVERVSWGDDREHGVQEFLRRLNEREKKSVFRYRLPTEAEWEYSCRGGATSQEECGFDFYFAQPSNDLSFQQANFDGRNPAGNASKGDWLQRTTKVGSYQPNRLGLYDMHGNVWEWCEDLFQSDGSARVFRGGSGYEYGINCRASFRFGIEPGIRGIFVGFRLASVPSEE